MISPVALTDMGQDFTEYIKTDMKLYHDSRRSFIKSVALGSLSAMIIPDLLSHSTMDLSGVKASDGKGLTILFQGDSITDGNRGRNYNDLNHIMGHGYAFSIASRLGAAYPEKNLKFINRGISGNKVNDLSDRWEKDTLDLSPGVLSILVGINDSASVVFQREPIISIEKYEEIYNSLLVQTKEKFHDIIVILCEPFILPVGKVKDNFKEYTADLRERQLIVRNLATKHNAVFVGLQAVFNKACERASSEYWMWDGVHPTVAGHELITREWMNKAGRRLKFIKYRN